MLAEIEELELLELEKEKYDLGIQENSFNNYVKPDKSKGLTEEEINELIQLAVSQIPKSKPEKVIERVIEKQFIREKKDETKYAEEKSLKDLKKEVQELKDLIERFKESVSLVGGSGVIGLPSLGGQGGKTLTNDGTKPYWTTLTAAGGSSQSYSVTNVTTRRSMDANNTSLDELADIIGTLIQDFQAVGLLQ